MKPKPFSALKNFTVPCATNTRFSVRPANQFGRLAPRTVLHRSVCAVRLGLRCPMSRPYRGICTRGDARDRGDVSGPRRVPIAVDFEHSVIPVGELVDLEHEVRERVELVALSIGS